MRRDPIFYQMFQRSPSLLFELIGDRPANAANYRFDSVAIKEPKFEIDGVFLPPEAEPGIVYFCEVQFQKDETLYERLFSESFLYFYRNRPRFSDWHAVIIYPTRSLEPIHYADLVQIALTLNPSPKKGEGLQSGTPLLPFWEKGLGDEGKPDMAEVSPTFA